MEYKEKYVSDPRFVSTNVTSYPTADHRKYFNCGSDTWNHSLNNYAKIKNTGLRHGLKFCMCNNFFLLAHDPTVWFQDLI
jgi:hypothetical protein